MFPGGSSYAEIPLRRNSYDGVRHQSSSEIVFGGLDGAVEGEDYWTTPQIKVRRIIVFKKLKLRRYAETLKCSGLQRWLKEHRRITPKISTHDIQYQTDPNIGQTYAGQIPHQTQYAGESISRYVSHKEINSCKKLESVMKEGGCVLDHQHFGKGTVKGESMLKDVQGAGDVTINRRCPEPDKRAKFMMCSQVTGAVECAGTAFCLVCDKP
ncbi:hypothetical protein GWI33_010594 [Rhynchophorus ferrugineus]|uniref:Uncharacterized protein n=1 Tax=Rhynchophorus ferrugineus TaxID=354439 RepID=A0A834MKB5_RHYFE|nr:hypothetical protein GWI33_010594 [Rhynchophorus ferrugineus]